MSDINFCNTKEQLNHLGEVVTGKTNGSPSGADIETSTLPYTGQVRNTLPALEELYLGEINEFIQESDQVITDKTDELNDAVNEFIQESDQVITDKTDEFDTSIANKEAEADAAIDEYRQTNKGEYAAGITLENKFEFITYNGESYFATNPPYTTTATTPDADGNLFVGGYINQATLSSYTDIVYKSSGGNSAVENMVAGTPIESSIGDVCSTGGTSWERVSNSGMDLSDFNPIGDVWAEDFGVASYPSDTTEKITEVFKFCDSIGVAATFGSKKYIYTTPSQVQDRTFNSLTVKGSKMPSYNKSIETLEDGTIFVGTFNLRVNSFQGYDFGCDRGLYEFPSSSGNGLALTSQTPSMGGNVVLERVVGLCDTPSSQYHALLVEGFNSVDMISVKGYNSVFGAAIKSIDVNISNAEFKYNDFSNIIIKSDVAFGNCKNVNISNVICEGSDNTSSNIDVQTADAPIEKVNISNYNLQKAESNIVISGGNGTTLKGSDVSISNGVMSESSISGVLIGGYIDNISISGQITNAKNRAIQIQSQGEFLSIDNTYCSVLQSSPNIDSSIITGSFFNVNMSNVTCCVDYDPTNLAGVNFTSIDEAKYTISSLKANVFGNHPYEDGFSNESISGTDQQVTPAYSYNTQYSYIDVTTGGVDSSISTIIRTMNGTGENFPRGYKLYVKNADSGTLTINASVPGFIFIPEGLPVDLNVNEIAVFVFNGAQWYLI